MTTIQPVTSDIEFLYDCFEGITDERNYPLPSEYIESVRYLPKELTPFPGYYDYDRTPYLREIVDHFSPLSPTREVVFMKPSQIGATTGVLEAIIAYYIGAVPTPQLYISADKKLVETGMKTKVERMLDSCGLRDLIASQTNVKNTRRKGDTISEKEYPGGFLHAIGAQSPGKLRQMSYPVMSLDELDGFPEKLGNEGDPVALAKNRTIAFASKRKLLYLSTPLVLQTSKIYKLYLIGDQRHYLIPCKHCGEYIVLFWHLNEAQTTTGDLAGIVFKTSESGKLIPETVKYKTQCCGKHLENHDKAIFLPDGFWRATDEPDYEGIVSYWLNALYSPLGMYSWTEMVLDWMKAWDVQRNRVKDLEEYKSFRNTKQGLPWEERGESPKYERVIQFRRQYARNQIPNRQIAQDSGSPILLLIASVDVHADNIMVDIKGYCRGGSSYTIDFRIIEGDTKTVDMPIWRELEKIIEHETWVADDGKIYKIRTSFIDEGYRSDVVREFCKKYSQAVYPVKGAEWVYGNMCYKLMSKAVIEQAGCLCYEVNTTILKDRVAYSFRRDWNTGELQPPGYPNFPNDLRDDYFRYFEAEHKVEEISKKTNRFLKFVWKKDQHKENHGLDTFVYSLAALELVASNICVKELELDSLDWDRFWTYAETGIYYEEAA